jgi:hypothetical protein
LRIKVHQKDGYPLISQGRGQIDGCGGLAYATFLVGDCENGRGHRITLKAESSGRKSYLISGDLCRWTKVSQKYGFAMSHIHNICGNSNAVSDYQDYLARMAAARRSKQGSATSGTDELRSFDSAIDAEREAEGEGEGEAGSETAEEFVSELPAETDPSEASTDAAEEPDLDDESGDRVWRA